MAKPVVGVEVDSAELRRALRYIGDAGLKKELRDANKSAAQVVVDRALPNVPVRTGKLRRSVRALGSQRDGRAVAGRAAVPYAAAIHWGRKVGNVGWPPNNRKGLNPIKGRPFLWDAAREHQAEVVQQYEESFDRLLDHIRGS